MCRSRDRYWNEASSAGMDTTRPLMRSITAVLMFLVSVVRTWVLDQATTSEGDANIGGGLTLIAGLAVGVILAVRTWRRDLTWRVLGIGVAVVVGVFALTYGLDALDKTE